VGNSETVQMRILSQFITRFESWTMTPDADASFPNFGQPLDCSCRKHQAIEICILPQVPNCVASCFNSLATLLIVLSGPESPRRRHPSAWPSPKNASRSRSAVWTAAIVNVRRSRFDAFWTVAIVNVRRSRSDAFWTAAIVNVS
jgi:hypothetical protein